MFYLYIVVYANGTQVKFNEHLMWIRIEAGKGESVPEGMIHEGIRDYFSDNGISMSAVTMIEKVPRTGYDITLSDGRKLLFDTKGKVIR